MASPHLESFDERELLGSGVCGAVFRGARRDGTARAVKLLDGMAIHRGLLETAHRRLTAGGWPEGAVRVIEADYNARPATCVMECLADRDEGGNWRPRSLQHRLADFPGEDSWSVVLGVAQALAGLHERQVAHGNLKPGNVFFGDEGEVLLSDWALGNMPGVAHLQFTDAILYQPPEQLRSPEGFLDEQGYRWDVFAFGVLAYRLLTGRFPRCEETFQEVAPPAGETSCEGIAADMGSIAQSLEQQPEFGWPGEAESELEEAFRGIIVRCLSLEPMARPANALELRRMLLEAETASEEEARRDAVLDQRRRAQHTAWRASLAAGVLAAVVAVVAMLWQLTRSQLGTEITGRRAEVEGLETKIATLDGEREVALEAAERAETELKTERATWLARIEESRAIGDRLFAWAMEEGRRRLPPLDDRRLRLERLERYFTKFLERTARVPGLEEERARARLQLAEIALAERDPEKAAPLFEKALRVADKLGEGADLELRLATDRLLLALLWHDRGAPRAEPAMAAARQALEAVPLAEVDADRVRQLLAILDIHESRQMAAVGDEQKALERLHRATEALNSLSDARPEAAVLRSELVACYLSSATILDGLGEMGDARAVRDLAAEELLDLIKERPDDLSLKLELAGCYGAIAESSMVAGDLNSAESYSRAADKLLSAIVPQQPENAVARSRLAAQRGLMAGILRDRGEADEAMKLYDEGLSLLEGLVVGERAEPIARYRFALLTWEKGRMLGFSGRRAEEIEHQQRAAGLLEELLETPWGVGHTEQLQRSLGYLLGDLGHAAQLAGDEELSSRVFARAVGVWERLHRERPGSEEYEEALAWNRQRLDEL